jgi:hypothetical protein
MITSSIALGCVKLLKKAHWEKRPPNSLAKHGNSGKNICTVIRERNVTRIVSQIVTESLVVAGIVSSLVRACYLQAIPTHRIVEKGDHTPL